MAIAKYNQSSNRIGKLGKPKWIKNALKQFVATTLSMLISLQPVMVQAQQINADPNAGPNRTPTIGSAPNGVPLIDIAKPNGQGLSHNQYNNFNVGNPGVILNNHNQEIGTSNLGGVTPGNPNLRGTNGATVILNEVTSGNRSALNGATEVFGRQADVIIANPNGITCDGCGFINTPRATLTTGTPNIGADGRLQGFTVRGGDVTFGSRGGNFAAGDGAVDLFDVVSRTIQIDGPIYAKNLRLTAGANNFNYATGEATAIPGVSGTPQFAIDGSALGAMHADRISVVVTEKGAGVRMRGDMAANAGQLTLSADGKISLGNVSGRDGVSLSSSGQVTAKRVTSTRRVVVKADKGVELDSVAANEDVLIQSTQGAAQIAGAVETLGNANITARNGIELGSLNASGQVTLTSAAGDIDIDTFVQSGDTMSLTASSGNILAGSLLSYGNMSLTAGLDLVVDSTTSAAGDLMVDAGSVSMGTVIAGVDYAATEAAGGNVVLGNQGTLQITTRSGDINTSNLLSAGATTLTSAGAVNTVGITSRNDLTVHANGAVATAGDVLAAGDATLEGASLSLGTVVAGADFAATDANGGNIILGDQGSLALTASNGNLSAGSLLSAGSTTAASSGSVTLNSVTSHGNLAIDANGAVTSNGALLAASDAEIAGSRLNLNTVVAGVDFAASEASGGGIVLGDSGELTLQSRSGNATTGVLMSAGSANITSAGTFSTTGLTSRDMLTIAAIGAVTATGDILAAVNTDISGSSLSLGTVVAGVDFAASEASASGLVLGADGTLSLVSTNGAITTGNLLSAGDLTASAATNLTYASLQSRQAADLEARNGDISLDNATIAMGDLTLRVDDADLTQSSDTVQSGGALIIHANTADLSNTSLTLGGLELYLTGAADLSGAELFALQTQTTDGDIVIEASGATTNTATALLAQGDLTLTLASLINHGQLAAANDLTITTTGNLTNSPTGLIYAGHDANLFVAGTLTNNQGAIQAGSDLVIARNAANAKNTAIINRAGLIQSGNNMAIYTLNLTNERLETPVVITTGGAVTRTYVFSKSSLIDPAFELDGKIISDRDHGGVWKIEGAFIVPYLTTHEAYGVAVLPDGSSYKAWNWLYNSDLNLLGSQLHEYDPNSHILQTVSETSLVEPLTPQGLISTGGDLIIEATTLTNSYSTIEAEGNARLSGTNMVNEGLLLTNQTTTTCKAQSACEAYHANGSRNFAGDIQKGATRVDDVGALGSVSAIIRSEGNLQLQFTNVDNTSEDGSIAGFVAVDTDVTPADPLDALNGLTAGGALFDVNGRVSADINGGLNASGTISLSSLTPPSLDAGGFGGTIPGQFFLYETRAAFLDIGRFYGSGYFVNRIGYQPDRSVPFLGDAYFENQLIDQQLRQQTGQSLNSSGFLGGSNAIERMKDLLERGADYIAANGLNFGRPLTAQQASAITQSMVIYETRVVNGLTVYAPVLYLSEADREQLSTAGALIAGAEIDADLGGLTHSGAFLASKELNVSVDTSITSNGGSFVSAGSISLSAQSITMNAQSLTLNGQTVINPGGAVNAGGDFAIIGKSIAFNGVQIEGQGNGLISASTLELNALRSTGDGYDYLTGTQVSTEGSLALLGSENITITASSARAGNGLSVVSENGDISILADTTTSGTSSNGHIVTDTALVSSQLSSGQGETFIGAGSDVVVRGSHSSSSGNTIIAAGGNILITAEQTRRQASDDNYTSERITNFGSSITSNGNVLIVAGGDGANDADNGNVAILGSDVNADGNTDIIAENNTLIGEVTNQYELDVEHSWSTGALFGRNNTYTEHRQENVTVGSSISGTKGVSIRSGNDTLISASDITAGNQSSQGNILIDTGGDLTIASGIDVREYDSSMSSEGRFSKRYSNSHRYAETSIGSGLSATGNITLNAGDGQGSDGNLTIVGSTIYSQGSATLLADQDVAITTSQDRLIIDKSSSSDGLLSQSATTFKSEDVRNVVSNILVGEDLTITAGRQGSADLEISASNVLADGNISLSASNDVLLTEQYDTHSSESTSEFSGIMGSMGDGSLFIGYGSSSSLIQNDSSTAIVSVVGAGENLNISTGNDFVSNGAVIGAGETANFNVGNNANFNAVTNAYTSFEHHEQSQFGLTIGVHENVSEPIESLLDTPRMAASGQGNIGFQAISAVSAGLRAYDSIKTLTDMAQGNGSIGGISIGLGFSSSESESAQQALISQGGSVEASELNITTGGDLTTQGTAFIADDATLDVGGDASFDSAVSTTSATGSSSSHGAGVSLNVGIGTQGPNASVGINAHTQSSEYDSTTVGHENTTFDIANNFEMTTGGDTTLRGATINADTADIDIGGNLVIESLPDTIDAENSSQGGSVGVSINLATGAPSVSLGANMAEGEQSMVWIDEQSGIITRNEADIDVDGDTTLIGGVIGSESGDLDFSTSTLETQDLELHDHNTQMSASVNVNIGMQPGITDPISPAVTAEGSYYNYEKEGIARATIGEGNVTIRDADGDGIEGTASDQAAQDAQLANINRDLDTALEVTSVTEEGFEVYVSDESVKAAIKAGKAVAEIMQTIGQSLIANGGMSKMDVAKGLAVYSELERLGYSPEDIRTCVGRQGSLWDIFITPAHAGDKCATITNQFTSNDIKNCISLWDSAKIGIAAVAAEGINALLEAYERDPQGFEDGLKLLDLPSQIILDAVLSDEMKADIAAIEADAEKLLLPFLDDLEKKIANSEIDNDDAVIIASAATLAFFALARKDNKVKVIDKVKSKLARIFKPFRRAPNRADWPELSGSLREGSDSAAAALRGERPINFGMGTFNREQTVAMGEAWVGPGYRVTSRGFYESADGLRQFRPPTAKPNSQFATTGVQANFEQRLAPTGAWGANGHVNVTP